MSNPLVTDGISAGLYVLIIVLALWSAVWKAFALYRAGRVKDPVWFVVLFVLNTVGILEILYLFVFSKRASKRDLTRN